MKKYVCEYEAYEYDELSKEAKKKALINHLEINVAHDWWEFTEDDFREKLKEEAGIELGRIYWSLDREYHAYSNKAYVIDPVKLAEAAGIANPQLRLDGTTNVDRRRLVIRTNGELMHGNVFDENDDSCDEDADKLELYIRNQMNEYLKRLTEEQDYLYSDEAVEETIRANEMEFDKDGCTLNWGNPVKVREKPR